MSSRYGSLLYNSQCHIEVTGSSKFHQQIQFYWSKTPLLGNLCYVKACFLLLHPVLHWFCWGDVNWSDREHAKLALQSDLLLSLYGIYLMGSLLLKSSHSFSWGEKKLQRPRYNLDVRIKVDLKSLKSRLTFSVLVTWNSF